MKYKFFKTIVLTLCFFYRVKSELQGMLAAAKIPNKNQ